MNRIMVLVAAVTGGVVASSAPGAITYVEQNRRIAITTFINGQNTGGVINAENFGDFNAAFTRPVAPAIWSASVSQHSRLLSDAILIDSSARVWLAGSGGMVETQALSNFDVTFSIDTPTPFTLAQWRDQTHDGAGIGSRRFYARLQRQSPTMQTVFDWVRDTVAPDTWEPSPFSGMLQPGQYRLEVQLSLLRTINQAGTTTGDMSFQLLIPAPGSAAALLLASIVVSGRRRRRDA